MAAHYIFDDKQFNFKKQKQTAGGVFWTILKYFVISVVLAAVYYFVFSMLFNTDVERKLKRENKLYGKIYPEMEKKEKLLSDVVAGLQMRDDDIYNEIFHMSAPSVDRLSSVAFLEGSDSLHDEDIAEFTYDKIASLEKRSSRIEDNFKYVLEKIAGEGYVMPPMSSPVKGLVYSQAGATVGDKINPFYKVKVEHRGFDIVAATGTPVHSTADGIVSDVRRSAKGPGNYVEISHDGGYVTRYTHLKDVSVSKGRAVKKGTVIGHVGMSGMTFAPHLHYELYKDEKVLDPVHYMMGSMNMYDYIDMLVLSVNTGQSMD